MASLEGRLVGSPQTRIAVAVARWNSLITDRLLEGCLDALERHGVDPSMVDTARVPGCFELPLAASRLARTGRYEAVVCLGALIRGATPHFDHIASSCTAGLSQVALQTGVPIIYGVLTCDTIEQAIERAGTKAGNKGVEAAQAAIEMADLLRRMPEAARPDA